MRFKNWLISHWYKKKLTFVTICLMPLSYVFGLIVFLRRFCYKIGLIRQIKNKIPIIVVGNLTVGGTGKTPVVIYLVDRLRKHGFYPGIVARGVGGAEKKQVRAVFADSDPYKLGDEAVLLAKRCQCPVRVSIDRVAAVRSLQNNTNCDVVISDDGLQHYRLARDFEIILLDGMYGLGNKCLLPAGPLRENPRRIKEASVVWQKGIDFSYKYFSLYYASGVNKKIPLNFFVGKYVHAVAGIANPDNFFNILTVNGVKIIRHIFADHHNYIKKDLQFADNLPILMTEKDAVKCNYIGCKNFWYLPVEVLPENRMLLNLEDILCKLKRKT